MHDKLHRTIAGDHGQPDDGITTNHSFDSIKKLEELHLHKIDYVVTLGFDILVVLTNGFSSFIAEIQIMTLVKAMMRIKS